MPAVSIPPKGEDTKCSKGDGKEIDPVDPAYVCARREKDIGFPRKQPNDMHRVFDDLPISFATQDSRVTRFTHRSNVGYRLRRNSRPLSMDPPIHDPRAQSEFPSQISSFVWVDRVKIPTIRPFLMTQPRITTAVVASTTNALRRSPADRCQPTILITTSTRYPCTRRAAEEQTRQGGREQRSATHQGRGRCQHEEQCRKTLSIKAGGQDIPHR